MTNSIDIAINTIDKIAHVCYNENKLENKTNILTNNKINKETNMKQAQRLIMIDEPEDPGSEENIDYEPFKSEKSYISPDEVGEEVIDRIRELPLRLATVEITY